MLWLVLIAAPSTMPPDMIYPAESRKLSKPAPGEVRVYDDDPRIPEWCTDPVARERIKATCGQRSKKARQDADRALAEKEQQRKDEEAKAQAAAREAQAAKQAADAAAEAERRVNDAKTAAKKGYKIDFDNGLSSVLAAVRGGELRLGDLKKVALPVWAEGFEVMQIIDQNNVLFRDSATDIIVWLRNYRKQGGEQTWMEEARLESMEYSYVVVKGTKVYKTLLGTKQAIVVEALF